MSHAAPATATTTDDLFSLTPAQTVEVQRLETLIGAATAVFTAKYTIQLAELKTKLDCDVAAGTALSATYTKQRAKLQAGMDIDSRPIDNARDAASKIILRNDEALRAALVPKLPGVRGVECVANAKRKTVCITFDSCLDDQLENVKKFLRLYIPITDAQVEALWHDELNHSRIQATISPAERSTLLRGLGLTEAPAAITSTRLVKRY